MSDITISHTPAEGTLAFGTDKGDGAGPILKRCANFHWGRSIGSHGAYYIRNSRDRAPRLVAIERAAEELRAAGHTVTVDIDAAVRDNATVRADQHERLEDRRDALAAKGDRLTQQAAALHRRSDAMVEHFPMGQPVASGARGRAHRNVLDRSIDTAIRASLTQQDADRIPDRIAGSLAQERRRELPGVTARRVDRLEAELRSLDRRMVGLKLYPQTHSETLRRQYEGERAVLVERIAGDRAVLDDATAAGRFGQYSKANVHKGDRVMIRSEARTVVRASAKSVSVETGYSWTDRYGYEEITGAHCPHVTATDKS